MGSGLVSSTNISHGVVHRIAYFGKIFLIFASPALKPWRRLSMPS